MSHATPGTTRLDRFVRGHWFDHNPLRRTTDRVETALLALLIAVFLVSAPFVALATGAWVHGMAQRAQLAEEAANQQVTAVVLAVTVPSTGGAALPWEAQVRWRAPDGREVSHQIPVPFGTVAGGTLQVWTDRTGDIGTAPPSDSQVIAQTDTAEVLGVVVLAGVLILAGALTHSRINKRQLAAWDADWHVTGPRWTTHT